MTRIHIGAALAVQLALVSCVPQSAALTPSASPTLRLWFSPTPEPTGTPLPTASGAVEAPGPTPTPFVHIVQAGDSLLLIAARYGVSLEDLVLANPGIDPQFLSIGQQVRIPGEGGQPVDVLLPTPTPMPISISRARCFESISGVVRCLALVQNPLDRPVEGITAVFELLDDQGARIAAQEAHAPLRRLEKDALMPLMAVFPERSEAPAGAYVSLLAATEAVLEAPSFVPAEVRSVQWENLGRTATVQGEVVFGTQETGQTPGAIELRILVFGLDQDSEVVGSRLWEEVLQQIPPGGHGFEITLFSLGPEIAQIEVYAEAAILNP